ncbi:hypothetical protein KM043_004898 [Ampulex compressa]|nr:hypothetical protein KM043_004898 [Ampulex compressa]
MTKIKLFINILFLFLATIFNVISECSSDFTSTQLCYDPKCKEPVSFARTMTSYNANAVGMLSFPSNAVVTVYSKESGKGRGVWGVEINGLRGYVPQHLIREYKVLHAKLLHKVSVKVGPKETNTSMTNKVKSNESITHLHTVAKNGEHVHIEAKDPNLNVKKENLEGLPVNPDSISSTYDVVDGTTFHFDHTTLSQQTTTTNKPVEATTVPYEPEANNTVDSIFDSVRIKTDTKSDESMKTDHAEKVSKLEKKKVSSTVSDSPELVQEHQDIKLTDSSNTTDILKGTDEGGVAAKTENVDSLNNIKTQSEVKNVGQDKQILHNDPNAGILKASDEISNNKEVHEHSMNVRVALPVNVSDGIALSSNDTDSLTQSSVPIKSIPETTAQLQQDLNNTLDLVPNLLHTKANNESDELLKTDNVEKVSSEQSSEQLADKLAIPKGDKLEKEKVFSIVPGISQEVQERQQINDTESTENVGSTTSLDNAKVKLESENVLQQSQVLHSDTNIDTSNLSNETSTNKDIHKQMVDVDADTSNKDDSISAVSELADAKQVVSSSSEQLQDNGVSKDSENLNATDNVHDTSMVNSDLKDATLNVNLTTHLDSETLESTSQLDTHESKPIVEPIEAKLSDLEEHSDILPDAKLTLPEHKNVEGLEVKELKEENNSKQIPMPEISPIDVPLADEIAESFNVPSDVPMIVEDQNITSEENYSNTIATKEDVVSEENAKDDQKLKENSVDIVISERKIVPAANLYKGNMLLHRMIDDKLNVNVNIKSNDTVAEKISATEVPIDSSIFSTHPDEILQAHEVTEQPSEKDTILEHISNFNEFPQNRNLLNVEEQEQHEDVEHPALNVIMDKTDTFNLKTLPEYGSVISDEDKVLPESVNVDTHADLGTSAMLESILHNVQVPQPDTCASDDCENIIDNYKAPSLEDEETLEDEESAETEEVFLDYNYLLTLTYLSATVLATLVFSLGYYYIENMRRDGELIAKINKLEKDLLVSTTECTMLSENLKLTKDKLNSIEDESFGSNEMVVSLKADLEASQNSKLELEDQINILERDLESATEAGLELERMLREVLSSNNDVNPLAQSVEELQTRLNTQQSANESLASALKLKTQENEALMADLNGMQKKYDELELELAQITENLKAEINLKRNIEQTFTDKVQKLEMQIKEISTERLTLRKELKEKEAEVKDFADVINQLNVNNLDLEKLYDVSHIKAEATELLEERNELRVRLSEVEGAHNLLEEHMKLIKEEVSALSEQCKAAEKEKKDAETRLEVLSAFFNEKEAQRQKEEAAWLQKQGEVMSTVERIQTMQNEIQSYKQQLEMLKREIVDQEREYKGQISVLETKAHEQWVAARQSERRLEESKAEAGQLRNRLTLIEKNINDADSEVKLHRLEANGETATSPPLFIGADSSSSPIMFTGTTGVPPPPPPSYMHCTPPYLPLLLPSGPGARPYEVGQRPPPLGGRLSSPPPIPMHPHPPPSGRYDSANSPPPLMSPHLLPPFNHHRSPPPPPPNFGSDPMHLLPPSSAIMPPLLGMPTWAEESLPPPRHSGFQPHQREQRARNHKGSLHSSGESLDKVHHGSKV